MYFIARGRSRVTLFHHDNHSIHSLMVDKHFNRLGTCEGFGRDNVSNTPPWLEYLTNLWHSQFWNPPEHYKVSAGMWGHTVEDILEHFRLPVQDLTHFPVHQIHVPQVAFPKNTVQNHRRRSLHLHRSPPAPQRVPITHLESNESTLLSINSWNQI